MRQSVSNAPVTRVSLPGQTIAGGIESTSVTAIVQVSTLPLPSVAYTSTLVVSLRVSWKAAEVPCVNVTPALPQLSVALTSAVRSPTVPPQF